MIKIDTVKTPIRSNGYAPFNLEKIIIETNYPIVLDLNDWENAGLRIGVELDGFGSGYYNSEPYSSKEVAIKEYEHVLDQVQKGNYFLELHKKNKLKLRLTDSK